MNSAAEGIRGVIPDKRTSADEEQYDTLRQVYLLMKKGLDDLDKWAAFDLTETELKLKQQIKAHQLAYDLIAPLFESIQTAMINVNAKYKEK